MTLGIWKHGRPPDFLGGLREKLHRTIDVLEGREPPSLGQGRTPALSLAELVGLPCDMDERLVRHILDQLGKYGEIGEELTEQRRKKEVAEATRSRLRQHTRHAAGRRAGLPSPLEALRRVVEHERRTRESRGAVAAVARALRKERSQISRLLRVAEAHRAVLVSMREVLPVAERLHGPASDRQVARLRAEIDRTLRKIPSRRDA